MKISIIAAMGKNRVIGKDNKLPWYLPHDLQNFKKLTLGNSVIMGRKTFDSIGRPLPQRNNIVITRNKNYMAEGVKIAHSIQEALDLIKDDTEVFVIGGSQIYKQFMPYAGKLFLTRIEKNFPGDSFFPKLGNEWKLNSREEYSTPDFRYSFCIYINKLPNSDE